MNTITRAIWFAVALILALGMLARAEDEARVWSHMCPWFAVNNLAHNRRDVPLGWGMATWPGLPAREETQSQRDRVYECLTASEAGIDAFAVDIIVQQPLTNWTPALEGYLKAAETVTAETGRSFFAAPCLDGAAARKPDDLADYLWEMTSGRTGSPAWPKLDGKPIVWTYAGTGVPAQQWRRTLEILAERGIEIVLILDANSLFSKVTGAAGDAALPVAELDALAELPVALYPFRTDSDRAKMERCLDYLRRAHPDSLAARLSIGTIWPGYWSLGSGWFVDPECTGSIRNTFELAADSRWLSVTTWNDFYETTHFQPSIGFGTGRLDLLRALLSEWRGGDRWPGEPRLYVWQPNEIQEGDEVSGEVIVLLPDGPPLVRVRVGLCDGAGQVSNWSSWTEPNGPGVNVVPFRFAATDARQGTCAYLTVERRAGDGPVASCLSRPIPVWPGGYHPRATRRGTMWQVGNQAKGSHLLQVTREDGLPVRISVGGDLSAYPPGTLIHLRQDFAPIYMPMDANAPVLYEMGETYGKGRPSWEVFHPIPPGQRWGFFDAAAVLPDGAIRWSEPIWVPPSGGADLQCAGLWHLDEGDGTRASDSSPYGHDGSLRGETLPAWSAPGKLGASCLSFDGVDDYVNVPGGRFPPGDFTVSAWVKLDGATKTEGQQCIYADINGPVVLSVSKERKLQCARAVDGGWRSATGATQLPLDEWCHVAARYDQQTLKLYLNGAPDGEAPCTGTRKSNVTAIGCNPFGSRSSFLAGSIDEVKVMARALQAEELAAEAR